MADSEKREFPPIKMATLQFPDMKVQTIHPHDLAKDLHSSETYFLLDCRPVLAYDSCHITGAVNVNIVGLLKKRFVAGKIGLADLVTSDEGKERFKSSWTGKCPMVVYDESTTDMQSLPSSHSLWLVLNALDKMGRCPFMLQGGLTEFNVLHPSLCEINLPKMKRCLSNTPQQRATTPGMRDQPLDWKTAPPVHVLSFLVLGSEKDAQSKEVMKEFNVGYVLNVTPNCPNYFKEDSIEYFRISVTDTGSQKLITHFPDAFSYIEKARGAKATILIHCMAGISRSVTVTIAYLMQHFGMPMQDAYQFVKDKRPAISPNLNFMGQLVAFEKQLKENTPCFQTLDVNNFLPTSDQEYLSAEIKRRGTFSKNDSIPKPVTVPKSADSALPSSDSTDQAQDNKPFKLKIPGPRRAKKDVPTAVTSEEPIQDVERRGDMIATTSYVDRPTARGGTRTWHRATITGSVHNLLSLLRDQLLTHRWRDALKTMEGVIMAYDMAPDIARKTGIEVLLHDDRMYGEALQLFKQMFQKRLKHREETLLDMSLFIAQHGELGEAYETINSQISTEPYHSNPLLRGYCGVLQYLIWEQEVDRQKITTSVKREPVSSESSNDEDSDRCEENPLIRAYSKRALAHFDTLWNMTISPDDNMDYFLPVHYQLLMALGMKKQAYELLISCDEKMPGRLYIKRLICDHLRQHKFSKVNRRRHYLKELVSLDESCCEVVELVELLMEKVDHCLCHRLLLSHLDYPNNGHNQQTWDLLHRLHIAWPELLYTQEWLSRLSLWIELYPDNMDKHR